MLHEILMSGAALVILLVVCLFAAIFAANEYGKELALENLKNLDGVSPEHYQAALQCFQRAEKLVPFWKVLRDKIIAPFVLLIPLMRLPREANDLPDNLAYWRNNVSINGDGEAVMRDGTYVYLGDIGWKPEPGEIIVKYSDPFYSGDAYYARGHSPRSWYARWIWLAFRNVASLKDLLNGQDVFQLKRPYVLTEENDTAGGHIILRHDGGELYQLEMELPFAFGLKVRCNVGYKLGIVMNRDLPLTASDGDKPGSARASVICTWFALKG